LDCRQFFCSQGFDVGELMRALTEMSEEERIRRVRELLDWYYELPTDTAHQSWVKAAHMLAEVILNAEAIR